MTTGERWGRDRWSNVLLPNEGMEVFDTGVIGYFEVEAGIEGAQP